MQARGRVRERFTQFYHAGFGVILYMSAFGDPHGHAYLVFQGLDVFYSVYLSCAGARNVDVFLLRAEAGIDVRKI